jgi:hypothetical protein
MENDTPAKEQPSSRNFVTPSPSVVYVTSSSSVTKRECERDADD